MSQEFDLIAEFFTRNSQHTDLSVGDDAALISLSKGCQLAISADMSVSETHFFADADPYAIGWKSLAVNVSDMAAMGAMPKWATLAIALPNVNKVWLSAFSRGFFDCATTYHIDLIGGDTTRGPLNISVQIMGEVPKQKAIKRSGAQVGDQILVSGTIGLAALGLAHLQNKLTLTSDEKKLCLQALNHPHPRVTLGLALLDMATSCIDISDGLLADLGHVIKASNVGATIHLDKIPHLQSKALKLNTPLFQKAVLAGGDDYELCFTVPKYQITNIIKLASELDLPLTCIGEITTGDKVDVYFQHQLIALTQQGFDHFA
jgi:thiamine-monophosphate kinase